MPIAVDILNESLLASRLANGLRGSFAAVLRPDRHKHDMGHLLLIAGSEGMTGAMVLAALAAARSGCGLVTVAHPAGAEVQLNVAVPSVMTRAMDWQDPMGAIGPLSRYTAVAIGPGLGRAPVVSAGVREILSQRDLPPLALDADALWAVSPAGNGGVAFDFNSIQSPFALTPHLGEFQRLFAQELTTASARSVAEHFTNAANRYLILKQAETIIFSQHRRVINNRPNAGLASGGSGDVLLGLLGGLLAWMPSVEFACLSAVLAHSLAAEAARRALGELAMNPSDVASRIGEGMMAIEGILGRAM